MSSAKLTDRRKSYKAHTTNADGGLSSQQARRMHALEEQKRRREQRIDASRQLDLFADLHLGLSDDDDDDNNERITREGVAHYATLLSPEDSNGPPASATPSPASTVADLPPVENGKTSKKRKGQRKGKGKKKTSKWADKCMYAELLEMHDSPVWSSGWSVREGNVDFEDGLPPDLESGWVAVAPLPAGKRCLAVSMQAAGVSGIVPNTMLRSRLLGKVLLPTFPSPLPANTILDCILDEQWKMTGILHILDVIRWKGQDVASCEAGFRFWWRDTRLAELPPWPLPKQNRSRASPSQLFPYPATLIGVPYFSPTSFEVLQTTIIPTARTGRVTRVKVPDFISAASLANEDQGQDGMDVDGRLPAVPEDVEVDVHLRSDGILLYVAEAAYESGTSPLSVWIPASAPSAHETSESGAIMTVESTPSEIPIETFSRLVQRRILVKQSTNNVLTNTIP